MISRMAVVEELSKNYIKIQTKVQFFLSYFFHRKFVEPSVLLLRNHLRLHISNCFYQNSFIPVKRGEKMKFLHGLVVAISKVER